MKSGAGVSPAVAAVLVIILAVVVGAVAWKSLGPKSSEGGMDIATRADMSKITPDQLDTVKKNFEAARAQRQSTPSGK